MEPREVDGVIIALGGLVGGLITGMGVFFLALPQQKREEPAAAELYQSPRLQPTAENHPAANGSGSNGKGTMKITQALQRLHRNGRG